MLDRHGKTVRFCLKKNKGVLLFSCFSEEENLDDEENEEIDMTDLNK